MIKIIDIFREREIERSVFNFAHSIKIEFRFSIFDHELLEDYFDNIFTKDTSYPLQENFILLSSYLFHFLPAHLTWASPILLNPDKLLRLLNGVLHNFKCFIKNIADNNFYHTFCTHLKFRSRGKCFA